jgi:hypothetical protein
MKEWFKKKAESYKDADLPPKTVFLNDLEKNQMEKCIAQQFRLENPTKFCQTLFEKQQKDQEREK